MTNDRCRIWLITHTGLVREESGRKALLRGGPATFTADLFAIVRDYLKIHAPAGEWATTLEKFDGPDGIRFVVEVSNVLLMRGYPKPGTIFCVREDQVKLWVDAWGDAARERAAAEDTLRTMGA